MANRYSILVNAIVRVTVVGEIRFQITPLMLMTLRSALICMTGLKIGRFSK